MNSKYDIVILRICPFNMLGGINILPDLNYPARLCVLDREKGFAIDVETGLKYDYLETISRLYIDSMASKIFNSRRVAIPCKLNCNTVKINKRKASKIIIGLSQDEEFLDGNLVLDNEKYLETINGKNETVKKYKLLQLKKKAKN